MAWGGTLIFFRTLSIHPALSCLRTSPTSSVWARGDGFNVSDDAVELLPPATPAEVSEEYAYYPCRFSESPPPPLCPTSFCFSACRIPCRCA